MSQQDKISQCKSDIEALQQKLEELKSEEVRHELGGVYLSMYGSAYLLAQVDRDKVAFIGLESANRFGSPVCCDVKDWSISTKEFIEAGGNDMTKVADFVEEYYARGNA